MYVLLVSLGPLFSNTQHTQRTSVLSCPELLILQLIRFRHVNKETTPVDPVCTLSVNIATGGSVQYQLLAVIYHRGQSPQSGHYFADCFRPASHQWFRCDDRSVTNIGNDLPQLPHDDGQAYILFYQRVS